MEVIHGSIYDFPKYYDVLFGSDWKAEYDFLLGCFEKHGRADTRRLFEPACGTGRLLVKFAKAGYDVAGLDLNEKAVEYCNARLARHGLVPAAFVADMADFRLRRKVDAAFNTINSFRHLQSEEEARRHLRCVAAAVRKGGIYVLGFHLTPTSAPTCDEESWAARKGDLGVTSRMWTIERNLRARREWVGMTFDVYTPTRQMRLSDEIVFRTYRAAQFDALLRKVPEWERAAVYDFAYDLRKEIRLDGATEDVVFVLKKR